MKEKDENVAHAGIVSNLKNPSNSAQFGNSPPTRPDGGRLAVSSFDGDDFKTNLLCGVELPENPGAERVGAMSSQDQGRLVPAVGKFRQTRGLIIRGIERATAEH